MNNPCGPASMPASQAVVRLAWPLASVMLGETLMGLVDTKLVGGLGPAALGGVGLANAALYLITITTLGLMRSVKVCTAHAVGRGTAEHGAAYAQVGVLLGLMMGLVGGIGLSYAAPFLRWIGTSPALIPPAQAYLTARAWGLPAACVLAALMEHRQGMGDVKSSLAVGLGGNVVNAVLAYGLTYGHFGLPAWGVRGAGLGTALTQGVQLVAMAGVMFFAARRTPRRLGALRLPRGFALRELCSVGVPTALHFGCEYLAFAACTTILARLSDADVAAHQIAVVINRLAYLPGLAIGEVACILVSNAIGAHQLDEAERVVRAALVTAVTFMVGCGILLAGFGQFLAAAFTHDAVIVALTAQVLVLAGLFQVLDAVNIVMRGALRGARDVRTAAALGIFILWATVPPVTYLLGHVAGFGVLGGWCSFVLETALCALVYTYRWRHGSWRRAFVTHAPHIPATQLAAATS